MRVDLMLMLAGLDLTKRRRQSADRKWSGETRPGADVAFRRRGHGAHLDFDTRLPVAT